MQHVVHAGDGIRPPGVVGEVGDDEAQRVAVRHSRVREGGANGRLAARRSDGGTDQVALREQLEDAVAGDES